MSRFNRLAGPGAAQLANKIQFNTDRDAYNHLIGLSGAPKGTADKISDKATITEGYLRSERTLLQQNAIRFPLTVNDGDAAINVTEQRLQISQMFLVTQIMLGLYYEGGDPTSAIRAQAPVHTYPAIDVNTGTADVGVVYNSKLSIRVDQTTYFDALDTMRFKRAGVAQQGVEVSTGASQPEYVADSWDEQAWGMFRLTPFIFFGGQSDNIVELKLPVNIDLTNNYACAVFLCRGFLIQNAYANNA